ncbi:MAG: glycerophosphodiester phosphodiesterase family protein [Acidobacteriota bacterium]|nr:glycerophosphodiester phosphodiesterase family protein [Acidobacteriota bacterium]
MTDVVGHRGASGHAPETTLAAYRIAIQMGVDAVEADVHRLRDGTLVAIHDANLQRTTNGSGWIADMTLAELKALDAGSWFNKRYPRKARPEFAGQQVPTLQEIIDLVKNSSADLFIEIKDPERYAPDFESSLLSLVQTNRMEERTRFLSFSAQALRRIKDLRPSIPTVFLISRRRKDLVETAIDIRADELGIRFGCLQPSMVEKARSKGIRVSVWTVDAEKDMRRMLKMGVDRIITNYPDRLLRLLGRYNKGAANSTGV